MAEGAATRLNWAVVPLAVVGYLVYVALGLSVPRSTGRPHSRPTTPSGRLAKWPLRWLERWWRRDGLSCRSAGCTAQRAFSA